MLFKVDPRIFQDYPGAMLGVIAVHGMSNEGDSKEIQELLDREAGVVRGKLSLDTIKKHPHIASWREAYRKFGASPADYRSSSESLVTRILKGGSLGPVNKLVDLYNTLSIKYLLPIGGEDLAAVEGDIRLTIAGESEKEVMLLGDKEARAPKAGEVIYADDKGTLCRRWNWKQASRTKLTADTTDAFLVIDALPPVSRELLENAVHDLANRIEQYCGGIATVAFLDQNTTQVALKKDGSYLPLGEKKPVEDMVAVSEEPEEEFVHSKEHLIRVEKVEKLRALGIEPWPAAPQVTAHSKQVVEEFTEGEERHYALAGRLLSIRLHGKTAFAHLHDVSGKMQLYIRKDHIGEEAFEIFERLIDLGDILWVEGISFKTKTGEVSLKVERYTLLSKCLFPLPEKFHGLQDIEIKYRQRYLDLMTSDDTRERFVKRSHIITLLRSYLDMHGYLEVETPMLHPIAGGAAAKPFITHHNAFHSDFYLRIAPELYLKRLLVGGLERVYEINRNFRNEGVSTRHNPEFTMLEFYTAYQDYIFSMNLVEDMLRLVASKVAKDLRIPYGDHVLDFASPFKRLSMYEAVIEYAAVAPDDLTEDTIDSTLLRRNVKLKQGSLGEKIYALFDEVVEPLLIQPTFVYGLPIEVSPLTKADPENPSYAPRYELFVAGMELANSYNELNNPFEQAERFKEQLKLHTGDNKDEVHAFDADFIRALDYGLPPAVGVGIGIDRLVMVLTNTPSIKEVILFPTLKKKTGPS